PHSTRGTELILADPVLLRVAQNAQTLNALGSLIPKGPDAPVDPRNVEQHFPALQRAVRQAAAETGESAAYLPLMVRVQRETARKAASAQTLAILGLLALCAVLFLWWLKSETKRVSEEPQRAQVAPVRPPDNPGIHGRGEQFQVRFGEAAGQQDPAGSAQRVGPDSKAAR